MDADALDNMDEFFDFAALDQNADSGSNHFPKQQSVPLIQPDDVTNIDWAVEPAAHHSPTDDFQLNDMPMYDVSQCFSTGGVSQQWPSSHGTDSLVSRMVERGLARTTDQSWQTDKPQRMAGSMTHDEANLNIPSSYSPSLGLMQCNNVHGNNGGSPADTLDYRLEQSASQIDRSTIPANTSFPRARYQSARSQPSRKPSAALGNLHQPNVKDPKVAFRSKRGKFWKMNLQ
jgi:hypothetical protein